MTTSICSPRNGVAVVLMFLSSCTYLPRSGPDSQAIDRAAAVKVTTKNRRAGIDYVLIDLSKNTLSYFDEKSSRSLRSSFGGGKGGPPDIPLGFGDVVEVSIFEAQSGGLFIPSDAGSRPGNFITLPNQTIDRSGNVTVPYAGRVKAAGRTKEEVERDIEAKLSNRAIEPQVVVTTVTRNSSQVAVLGDVNAPKKVELTSSGDRILDVLSEAGGLSTPALETNVTLQRRGRTATIAYEALLKNPAENIYVAPDDTVFADHQRRTFVAFGANDQNGRFDFENTDLSLADGLAKAGGMRDQQANPAEVVVYRQVDRSALEHMKLNVSAFRGDKVPVVFRANLRDPSGFFAAQKFALADKDILYTSNSGSVELLKFLDIANAVTSTASGTSNVVIDTRDAAN
ncbi:polysaccharide biosynthesis/export family protein [Rhizobium sp. RAF56]|uniref:polysaccharide biosynthesis/export family protein n=1 Tax=Rhizobium sp. RAF56 TaxID=3233062 RepID=UPI003F9BC954